MPAKPANLQELIERVGEAPGSQRVKVKRMLKAVGTRSFGPIVTLIGLTLASPLVAIPGMPTLLAAMLGLVSVQALAGRQHLSLPRWLLRRSVRRDRLNRTLRWLHWPARFIDRLARPRLEWLSRGPWRFTTAACCLLIAGLLPLMEFVPLSAHFAGFAVTCFGVGLIARDGLFAIVAAAITAGTLVPIVVGMLG